MATDPELWEQALQVLLDQTNSDDAQRQIELLHQQAQSKDSEIEKAYAAYIAGYDTLEQYGERKKAAENERDNLLAEVRRLKAQTVSVDEIRAMRQHGLAIIRNMQKYVPPDMRQELVRDLVDRIELDVAAQTFTLYGALSGSYSLTAFENGTSV